MAGTLIVDKIQVDSGNTFQVLGNTGSVLLSANAAGITFAAGSAAAPSITTNNDTNTGIFFPAADTIAFAEGGAEVARFDSSGNFGIGTSSPAAPLDVKGVVRFTNSANAANYGEIYDGGGLILKSQNSNPMYFFTSNTERARIDTSGNLLVGTTSAVSVGAGTHILSLKGSGAATTWGVGPTSSFGNFYVKSGASTGVALTSSATSWASDSDERKKTALVPFSNPIEKVLSLRAGTGRYITDDYDVSRSFLIAQDVQKVLPEAVDANDDEQGSLILRYTDVIPLLVAAIKEQQQMIETLQDKVAALEAAQ